MSRLFFAVLVSSTFVISKIWACQCQSGVLPIPAIETVENYLVETAEFEHFSDLELEMVKYYPGFLDLIYGRGTDSCAGRGPQNEPMFQCSSRHKAVYWTRFSLLDGRICTMKVRVNNHIKRSRMKILEQPICEK
ncbi:MAG: hypothetical protein CL678_07785 [Bdellovibrionaceae bacterium]|nr:hypothetical protein [Pseudobdellovibrionaceae bacterium]|tara:strand:+ start:562 stop:966 length:405 start_codon:yes stop_codon:yes gene_type:complete